MYLKVISVLHNGFLAHLHLTFTGEINRYVDMICKRTHDTKCCTIFAYKQNNFATALNQNTTVAAIKQKTSI